MLYAYQNIFCDAKSALTKVEFGGIASKVEESNKT